MILKFPTVHGMGKSLSPNVGLEPTTLRLRVSCSIFVYCPVYTQIQVPTAGHQQAPGGGGLYIHTQRNR
jgi:hypothetical protein